MHGDAQLSEAGVPPPGSSYRTGDEPIPGYRLIEPLGRGGFGEVWKCQAPGGFLKAIKFVEGAASATDDAQGWLAKQEVQALELIKNIRHPFILTVERAELQRGTLMIVMELAERSLADLFHECEGRGERGIARTELLGYLHEAAEALDLMNFEHGLQHLDVKPQNLFLIGGHLKVADFGLVNRLPARKSADGKDSAAERGARGLTPRYAAPEILHQRISRRSDQYSLAIVFQELLTGEVPFKGRAYAHLVLQHEQAQPDLAPLPARDRDAVARALAKDPEDRFASCRDFVRALDWTGCVTASDKATLPETSRADGPPTEPSLNLKGVASLEGLTYGNTAAQTPLGEIWHMHAPNGETRWAYHLQRFALEDPAKQAEALRYLQNLRHGALMRFKVAELASHRIILLFDPWGPSLAERCRKGKLSDQDLLRSLAEVAHAVDQLSALSNLEHLGLSPDSIVQGLDHEQMRDFGLIALLWKNGEQPLDGVNPRYGAPELAQGRTSAASDQYSLAATYADLRTLQLTGKIWSPSRSTSRSRLAVIDLENIPKPERRVLARALNPDPAQRFNNCVALIDALADAKGGAASQTISAMRSAFAATEDSFHATLDDWLERYDAANEKETAGGQAAVGSVQAVCPIEIVPGTAHLRLDMFEQEWHAQRTLARENEYRFFLPLERTLWQRLMGRQVGVDIHILLEPIEPQEPKRLEATLTLRAMNCDAALARQVHDQLAPAMLQSLRFCLNAIPERRHEKRVSCRINVTIRHRPPGGRPMEIHGEVVNLSRTGAAMFTAEAIAPGGVIRMLMALPRPNAEPIAVSLKATVRRCEPLSGGRFKLGAAFLLESPKDE
jgi:serine/threonine protein kinase